MLPYLCDVNVIYWPSTVYAWQVFQCLCTLIYERLEQAPSLIIVIYGANADKLVMLQPCKAIPLGLEHCRRMVAVLAGQGLLAPKLQHLFLQDRCDYTSTTTK